MDRDGWMGRWASDFSSVQNYKLTVIMIALRSAVAADS